MQIGNINLYDPDLHKIPEYNWQKFQRCLLMDAGIGSNTMDIIQRADTIATCAANDRKDDLANELVNLKLALYSAAEGIDYQTMAFACLIQDIDGIKYPIATDTDIMNLSKLIAESDIKHADLSDYLSLVKKKLIYN